MLKRLFMILALCVVSLPPVLVTTGCANNLFGSQACVGPNCTKAEAYSTIAEMRSQTTLLVNADKLTAAKATDIRAQLNVAQTAVDTATNTVGDDQLSKARGILATLRTTLLAAGATLK